MNDLIPTGLADLDNQLAYGGLRGGHLVVIASRYGMGADTLAANVARNVAINRGIPTLFTSCRHSEAITMDHLVAAQAGVPYIHITRGTLDERETDRIAAVSEAMRSAPLFLNCADPAIAEIAERVAQAHVRLLVIEGAHLLLTDGARVENQEHRAEMQSFALKTLAGRAGIPVVVSVPLVTRDDKPIGLEPTLQDFDYRDSYLAHADLVLLTHRPDAHGDNTRAGEIDITIAKQRNGIAGMVTACFQEPYDRVLPLPKNFRLLNGDAP